MITKRLHILFVRYRVTYGGEMNNAEAIEVLEDLIEQAKRHYYKDYKGDIEVLTHMIALAKRVADVDEIRHSIISRMDLFMEWGKRSYKNTNDLKHEDTSDIITELATDISTYLTEGK